MPLIQRDAAFLHDTGDYAGLCRAGTNRANTAVPARDVINLRTHFSGGQKGIFTAVHWRAAGMGRLTVKSDRVTLDPKRSHHRAKRQIQVE